MKSRFGLMALALTAALMAAGAESSPTAPAQSAANAGSAVSPASDEESSSADAQKAAQENATSAAAAAKANASIEKANPKHLPAFPGAEGFGALATGGRGGEIVHVTNLNDSGPGSFRDAVSKPNRIVLFDVGGYIDLKSGLSVSSNLTLEGQTAPGDGIALKNYEVSFSNSNNIIVRYLRFRPGGTVASQQKKYAVGSGDAYNLIFDHCSIEWAGWDGVGMSRSSNITMQYCIIGENIDLQRFGCLCESDYVTFSHNLWIDNQSRNPKAKGIIQYINNVVYNWGVTGLAGGHSLANHSLDVINNYFIKGPSSNDHLSAEYWPSDHLYQAGNRVTLARDGKLAGRAVVEADFLGESGHGSPTFFPKPFNQPLVPVTLDSAEAAVEKVFAEAGASLHRDGVDARLIAQARTLGKEGKIIHQISEVGGFGELKGGPAPVATGKNAPPTDAAKLDASGYMNVEVYANHLVSPTAAAAK